jgi:hypothetical protein
MENSFGLMSFFGFGALGFLTIGIIGFLIAAIVIILKGYSLWHAARRGEKGWFIALLLINTFGILELVYLYFIVGKWRKPKNSSH